MPLYQGRTNSKHFAKLIRRAKDKIDAWSSKLLSTGGKLVLISSVLCSMHVYTLSAYAVSKKIIKELEGTFSSFLWGRYNGKFKKRWKSWLSMAMPTDEGGLGFRSLRTVLKPSE